ncbi:hypothetical protein EAI_04775 [Harpegnathos saltator]|uniref:Uncharacterized protein n=1 Tax=Harpegnathos saltator TaxID=610380 RepID=E2BHD7_HARSA|nr:hypothetical protein EAI_04775 [Harpegnathos saltator]
MGETTSRTVALADGRCSESVDPGNAKKATSGRPTSTDSAHDRGRGSRSRSKSRCEGSSFRDNDEDNDEEESSDLERRLIDGSLELSNRLDDPSRAVGRFRKAESFLKRLLRENVGERCDKLLRGFRESHSPKSVHSHRSPKPVLCSPRSRRRDIKGSPLSLERDIRESLLLDNKSNQRSLILEQKKEEEEEEEEEEEAEEEEEKKEGERRKGIRRNLRKDIQVSSSLLEKSNGENTLVERSSLPPKKSNRPSALPPDSNDQRRLPSEKEGANARNDIQENPPLLKQNDRTSPLLSRKNNTSIGQLMRLTANNTQEKAKFLPKSILAERSLLVKEDFEGTVEVCLLPQKTDIPLSQPAEKIVQDNSPSTKDLCSSTIIEETGARAKPVAPLRLKRTTRSNQPTDRLSYGSAIIHRRRLPPENSQWALQDPKKTLREQRGHKLKRSPPPEEEEEKEKQEEEEVKEEGEDQLGRESAGSDNGGSTDKYNSRCGLAVSRRHAEPRQLIVKLPEEQITISERRKGRTPSCAQQLVGTSAEDSILDSAVKSTGSVSERVLNRTHNEKSPEGTLNPSIETDDSDNTRRGLVVELETAQRTSKTPVSETEIPPPGTLKGPNSTEFQVPEGSLTVSLVVTGIDHSSTSKVLRDPEASNNQRASQKDSQKSSNRSGNPVCPRAPFIRPRSTDDGRMKLKMRMIRIRDKCVLALSAFAILFTLLLVMDLQMDLGYSGHHLVASHARIKLGERPDADTVYNNFRRKFLQRMNGSREQADATPGVVEKSGKADTTPPTSSPSSSSSSIARKHDDFPDLVDLVVNGYGINVDEGVARISGENHEYNPTIAELRKVTPRPYLLITSI